MKSPRAFTAGAVLFLLCCSLFDANAQNDRSSLKERGYEALSISAGYAFYNDLGDLTDSGAFENVTAGYRKVDGAYEILIDFGWMEEIIRIDLFEFVKAGPANNGLDYRRTIYDDGREEIFVSINIDRKMAIYRSEKDFIP